ncbi:MAG TPA: hypothetical protein PK772_08555 [Chitinophagaceae bacterium]|nr:hypothetical protein [Chitinophagaceae bacterium]
MISIRQILEVIPHELFIGNYNTNISAPSQIDIHNKDPHIIMWVNDKNLTLLEHLQEGTVICSSNFNNYKEKCNYIISENPRLTFKTLIDFFFTEEEEPYISPTAQIHPSVTIGDMVAIGHNVVIEKGCTIGNNTIVGHNTIIRNKTNIGNYVKIGGNNTIGGVGFGYEKDIEGNYSLMPHLGNVIIKDFVEIGNNTCIDRAVMGSTILHEHVKVDNLVHIAHGVTIGKNSLIIANAMIGGSTHIGENVWFAPSASALNKKNIANNATIGMGAVVLKDVKEGEIIIGNPGKILTK